jgi:hypothetical protein
VRWLWALLILHDLTGAEIFVKPDEVVLVVPARPPMADARAQSLVVVHDTKIYVRETPSEVARKVEEAK